jgi:hypothetical protein
VSGSIIEQDGIYTVAVHSDRDPDTFPETPEDCRQHAYGAVRFDEDTATVAHAFQTEPLEDIEPIKW